MRRVPVAGIASDSFNMQGLPAERAVAAVRNDSTSGPLNGHMAIRAVWYRHMPPAKPAGVVVRRYVSIEFA